MTGIQEALAAAKRAATALYEVAGIYAREIKERGDALFERASHFTRYAMAFLGMIFIVAWISHDLAIVAVPLLILAGFAVAFTFLTNWKALEIFAGITGVEALLASHVDLVREFENNLSKLLGEIRKIIAWLCAAGIYLAVIPISNNPKWAPAFLLALIGIVFAGELKWLRYGLIFILFVFTGIFWNGGSEKITTDVAATNRPAYPTFDAKHFGCGALKPDYDFFTAPDPVITPYVPAEGCWAKFVFPGGFKKPWIQLAGAEAPGDWLAVACQDGHVAMQPTPPSAWPGYHCDYLNDKEKNTLYIQGHIPRGITFKDLSR